MGLDDPRHELLQLRQRTESALAAAGMPAEERPFRPHLTLARTRRTRVGGELEAFLKAYRNHTFGHLTVSHIYLMRSDLDAKGAVYTRLHSVTLQGTSTTALTA
jgi:2'-5' RNA ligase